MDRQALDAFLSALQMDADGQQRPDWGAEQWLVHSGPFRIPLGRDPAGHLGALPPDLPARLEPSGGGITIVAVSSPRAWARMARDGIPATAIVLPPKDPERGITAPFEVWHRWDMPLAPAQTAAVARALAERYEGRVLTTGLIPGLHGNTIHDANRAISRAQAADWARLVRSDRSHESAHSR